MSDSVGTTERKKYLDAAKGWGILMVVFGHITKLGNPIDIWFGAYKLAVCFILFPVIFWQCVRVFARCQPENTSKNMQRVC